MNAPDHPPCDPATRCPDLLALVRDARADELPSLLGALESAKALAWTRLTIPMVEHVPVEVREERVLTIPQAAGVLGCKVSYVETLVRQHKLPTITLPGTNKAGEARSGKFRRILLSSLLDHLKSSEHTALDGSLSVTLTSARNLRRAPTNPQASRARPPSEARWGGATS